MDEKDYESQLEKLQGRLALAVRSEEFAKRSGAGLRGHGRRRQGRGDPPHVTAALDTRQYHVIPIAAPSDEERAQPLPVALLAAPAAAGQGGDL